jgi:hypothetical protein
MITYSTNFMGPISMDWFRNRGLTEKRTKIAEEGSILVELCRRKVGDVLEYDEVTTHYGGGRIDIRGMDPEEYYNGWYEYSLPIMHGEDFNAFSDWLDTLITDDLWTFDHLIEMFEKHYGKQIRWADDTWCAECFMKDGVHKMGCSKQY